MSSIKPLGILKPLGGGDPIPLSKDELVVGRRPNSDIRLDFENVSGKHCVFRYIKGIWHVRDLGSTNGTTLNGQKIAHEESVLPDDEVGVATHFFHIDYEPIGPAAVQGGNAALADDEEISLQKKQHSLVELAGLSEDVDIAVSRRKRPGRAPERIVRPSVDEAEFDDALPEHVRSAPAPKVEVKDDDFLKFVEEDVKLPAKDKGKDPKK
ncbi:MAG TPA: FHA domain-containing protein [Isosphaeraceae bacterium]|nr:FHA domain-containing protein [Isosphaeraceae bacterium]